MPEWMISGAAAGELDWRVLTLRLGLAAAFGLIVAGVFAITQRRPPGQLLPLATTLVLLTMLVAMTTIVIGDSVARAFGLVGALSIVRFRTVVDDTRDTSFVIFAVVVGMALGAGNLRICVIGVPAVSALAMGLSLLGGKLTLTTMRRLDVRIAAAHNPEQLLQAVFDQHLHRYKLVSVVSAKQGTSLDLVHRVRLRNPAESLALVQAINAVEGVQSVELRQE